jgi:hypothetical protein
VVTPRPKIKIAVIPLQNNAPICLQIPSSRGTPHGSDPVKYPMGSDWQTDFLARLLSYVILCSVTRAYMYDYCDLFPMSLENEENTPDPFKFNNTT